MNNQKSGRENIESILAMAMGGITEKVDYEMSKIIDNILDVNTLADKKRSLVLTIDFIPCADRNRVYVESVVKSKLQPTVPVTTSLFLTVGDDGEKAAVEMTPNIPGQMFLDGSEQERPKVLRLVSNN